MQRTLRIDYGFAGVLKMKRPYCDYCHKYLKTSKAEHMREIHKEGVYVVT